MFFLDYEVSADFMNNSGKPGLFTGRDSRRFKMLAHEAVVVHCEWVTSKKMQLGRFARRVKNGDNRIFRFTKHKRDDFVFINILRNTDILED